MVVVAGFQGLMKASKLITQLNLQWHSLSATSLKQFREIGNSSYYGFSLPRILKVIKIKAIEKKLLRRYLCDIIKKTNPDILHVFGTEMPLSFSD